ncbi:MAG: hypothetical protein PF485_09095 [Bacteroidales bacterium]|jgi:hypothetical protein|nr:hypothetical protein [Bacteroidales bacterium]
MNLFKILTGILFFLTLCSTGKEKSNNINYDVMNQKILFQYEFVNYAWGYQHKGWIIDSTGNVYCYDLPKNWHQYDSLGLINISYLESLILQIDSVCFTIDKIELYSNTALIEKASKGEISEPKQEMFDAGANFYTAYILNSVTNKYESVLLKQTGDVQIENKSDEAKELYKWLDAINHKIRNLNK